MDQVFSMPVIRDLTFNYFTIIDFNSQFKFIELRIKRFNNYS